MDTEAPLNAEDMQGDGKAAENRKTRSRRGAVSQIVACLVATTSVLGPAMGLGYSAVTLGPISAPSSGLKVTPGELSWIASITAIATPLGCILSSVSMRRGRRFAMIGTSVISAIGWLIIYLAPDVIHILVGRAICGIAMGLASTPATVYAAEISSPKLRGIVVTWTSVAIATGILIVYIFGYIFQTNWRLVALLCGGFPLLSIILVVLKMPESPVWLRSTGRDSEAAAIADYFSGIRGEDGTDPLAEAGELSSAKNGRDYVSRGALLTRENVKPFLIMLGYFFFQQFSGIFVVIYYAVDFTLEAGVRIDGHLAAILVGFTRLLGTVGVSYVSRKFGRRIPSLASGAGMTVFMGILAAYLWANRRGYGFNDRGVIPVLALLMYILTSTMGFLVLPFAMIGELYPARVKDVFSGITTCFAYVFSFFVLKIYPDMLLAFDKHGVFLFYGVMSLIGTIFVALFLPETKGRTLDEIEGLFKRPKIIVSDNKDDDNDLTESDILHSKEPVNGERKIVDSNEMRVIKLEDGATV